MDFTLIEKHPWITTGVVLGGGFLLFVVMRRGGSSANASPQYAAGQDPATAALNAQLQAQQNQTQAYTVGLQLQGATQISLAQIGADVSKHNTGLSAEVTDTQTMAQLQLGLGTLSAGVETARIGADVQKTYIDAIVAAFTGTAFRTNPATVNPPVSTATPGSPNPTVQFEPLQPAGVSIPGGTGGSYPVGVGGVNPGTSWPGMPQPGDAPRPGGTPILPSYNVPYCDPRDVACVMHNNDLSVSYFDSVNQGQAINNRNRCLSNAALSAGQPNYAALVAACG